MKEIEIKENLVRRNRIPILIHTTDWIQLFSNKRSKAMSKTIDLLESLISKEKDLEAELRDAERKKKILMNKIMQLSKDLNEDRNNSVVSVLEKAKKEILTINNRIPQLLEELENIPFEIDKQNTALLKETIAKGYDMINEYNKESEKSEKEINKLRESLSVLIQKKVDLEEDVSKLYSYLHGIMGATEMEKLDGSFL